MSVELLEEYIASGDLGEINALLQQNPALAKAKTSQGVSVLMLSCYYKKPDVTSLLLKHTDEINLFEASAAGKFDVVAHLIYNNPNTVNEYAVDGFTPLGRAGGGGRGGGARGRGRGGAGGGRPAGGG